MNNTQKTNSRYKNIIFDLGGVLVNWNPINLANDAFNIKKDEFCLQSPDEILGLLKDNLFQELDRGTVYRDQLISSFSNENHQKLLKYLFSKVKEHLFVLDKGVQILNLIKKHGYKTYVLSNFGQEAFEEALPRYKFLDVFDGQVISYKVRQIKPEEQIYKTLLNAYDLRAEECLFIDDLPANIAAAQKCGIDGIVCKNHEYVLEELKKRDVIFDKDFIFDKKTDQIEI